MKNKIFIPVIDTLLLFLTVIIIGVFSIRFKDNKGVGKESISPITVYSQNDKKFASRLDKPVFNAIILTGKDILEWRFNGASVTGKYHYDNLANLIDSMDENNFYVIYETGKNDIFGDLIRKCALKNIKINIGVSDETWR